MKLSCRHTVAASFIGYIVQAIVNMFVPLLFVTFQTQYAIPLSEITVLITVNFCVQLAVDFSSAFFIDKIGYRRAAAIAHSLAAAGLLLLTFLPDILPSAFAGLLVSVVVYAVGGGLLEVVISPIVEACPTKNKPQIMGILHSFYCWGSVAVIGISTLFFSLAGIGNWKIMTYIWAAIPLCNLVYFLFVPLAPLTVEGESLKLTGLLKNKFLWLFLLIIFCAGACEQSVSQWASVFAEEGLGVSKTVGDLLGPALFALCMGISRLIYGKTGKQENIGVFMLVGAVLCVGAYLLISLVPHPVAGFCGVALCGFSVGSLWPGAFSKVADSVRGGGTMMFAFMALAGDLGCALGPAVAGGAAGAAGDDLHFGILIAVVFPVILSAALSAVVASERRKRIKNRRDGAWLK